MECIFYKKGYRYRIVEEYTADIPIPPGNDIHSGYIQSTREGKITIRRGYAWDGPSGPTLDAFIFGSGSADPSKRNHRYSGYFEDFANERRSKMA